MSPAKQHKEACIRLDAQWCKCHWTVHVQWPYRLLSNYFGHLLYYKLEMVKCIETYILLLQIDWLIDWLIFNITRKCVTYVIFLLVCCYYLFAGNCLEINCSSIVVIVSLMAFESLHVAVVAWAPSTQSAFISWTVWTFAMMACHDDSIINMVIIRPHRNTTYIDAACCYRLE